MKRKCSFAICIIFVIFLMCSCGSVDLPSAGSTAEATEAKSSATITESAKSAEASASDYAGSSGIRRQVTDMAGRTVEVPDEISKVFATSPTGSITLYTLAPEKLLGWNYSFNASELQYIQEEYRDLPVYGMGDSLNLEAVMAAAPDVIIQVGGLNDRTKEQADDMAEQTGIPVLMYPMNLEDSAEVYEQLGVLLGVENRAAELAEYSQNAIDNALTKAAEVPEDQRVTVYYGNGVNSLNTAPRGNEAGQVFEMAGGINCAAIEAEDSANPGQRVDISPEQLIAWNPDIMFVNGEPKDNMSAQTAVDEILADPAYQSIQAVANGKVYGIPQTPFAWMDRPQSVNRIIGLVWCGALMYPDLYADVDIAEQAEEFYRLFYHVDLTAEEEANLAAA